MDLMLPENLTHLHLSGNQLRQFPMKIVKNISIFREIDLSDNQIGSFDAKLLQSVKNGVNLDIKGNPVDCDCRIRPLKHYLDSLLDLEVPDKIASVVCEKPPILQLKTLAEVADDNLNCADRNRTADGSAFDVFPDLIFRDIF